MKFLGKIKQLYINAGNGLNNKFKGINISVRMGLVATFFCALIAIIILFVPNIIGVADDGTATQVMLAANLDVKEGVSLDHNYFVREYVWKNSSLQGTNLQSIIIEIAKRLDLLVTGDRIFDIRFLAFIYMILYLPGIFLLVKSAVSLVNQFSEGLVVTFFACIMFSDVGYLAYFNSFYPEALIFILLIYFLASAMSLQRESKYDYIYTFLMLVSGVMLVFVRSYTFIFGIAGTLFLLTEAFDESANKKKIAYIISSLFLLLASIMAFISLPSDFNQTDKLHSMTRGVLLQSKNPEKTLNEFGIDSSFTILTDISVYEDFPETESENDVLNEDFYSKYNEGNVLWHYLRHPGDLISMTDLAVKANLEARKRYCGNYEESTGMPAGAQSTFWSAYSIYKNRSAPKTIGYLLILVGAYLILARKTGKRSRKLSRDKRVYRKALNMVSISAIGITVLVIVKSGESAFIQYNNQLGICMDLILFFVITKLLGRLNVLED